MNGDAWSWVLPPPVVVTPWVIECDEKSKQILFRNTGTGKYSTDEHALPRVPTAVPPGFASWHAVKDADGCWCYRDSVTGELDYDCMLKAPLGWRLDWSVEEQSFCWCSCTTGETIFEPPIEERCPSDDSGIDANALVSALHGVGLVPAVGNDASIRFAFKKFVLKHHPDKLPDADERQKAFFTKYMFVFKQLAVVSVGDYDIGASGEEVDQDVVVASEPPLVQAHSAVARATAEELVDIGESVASAAEQSALLAICNLPFRKWGFGPMERGEFALLEAQIRANAISATPVEIADSLQGDGWWLGLSWSAIAKALCVQCTLLLRDGWRVPWIFKALLVESAMRHHELGAPLPSSLGDLHDMLFGQSRSLRRQQAKLLKKCERLTCLHCGQEVSGDVHRKPTAPGEDRAPLSEVFCKTCYFSCVAGEEPAEFHETPVAASFDHCGDSCNAWKNYRPVSVVATVWTEARGEVAPLVS